MKVTLAVLCSIAALYLTGCGQADTRQADAQALKDNEARWSQEYLAKDVDKLVAHYADNAVLMGPGAPSVSGKNAIRKFFADMVADPAFALQFQASGVEVAKSSDLGYTYGTYRMSMTDPASKKIIHDHGSYVTTYSKQADGAWKAVADIATSEVPPPAPSTQSSK